MDDTPKELVAALSGNLGARRRFDKLAPSHQLQYIEWIAEAKKPETRVRRAEKAVEMILAPADEG